VPVHISPWEQDQNASRPNSGERPQAAEAAAFRDRALHSGVTLDQARPRVVMQFPANPNDMLLSGTLANGQYLSIRSNVTK